MSKSTVVSSAYGVSLQTQILNKILYVIGDSGNLQLLQSILSPFL